MLGWAIGGAIGAASITATGGSIGWRDGGAILGMAGAFVGWSFGATSSVLAVKSRFPTSTREQIAFTALGWMVAFVIVFTIAPILGGFFESATSAGFLGFITAAALGGGVGGMSMGTPVYSSGAELARKVWTALGLATTWALVFAFAVYIALATGMILGEIVKRALEPVWGWRPGLILGWGLGGALGGSIVGGLGEIGLSSVCRTRKLGSSAL